MSLTLPARVRTDQRATDRRFLMCPPDFFEVTYAINPWMDMGVPVDRDRAARQWEALRHAYEMHGHRVDVLAPVDGLPDMVFTANGALVVDGNALIANFTHTERAPEADHHLAWMLANVDPGARRALSTNEGEGDLLTVGDVILAGTGFRTDPASHGEVAAAFGRRVVTLELVDPRFYHLDVAIGVLDEHTIVWFPPAFSPAAQAALRRRFPDAIEATETDAVVLGCNLVSDGEHVFMDDRATSLAAAIRSRGFLPVPIQIDEFQKAGGGVKCLTLEIRPASPAPH